MSEARVTSPRVTVLPATRNRFTTAPIATGSSAYATTATTVAHGSLSSRRMVEVIRMDIRTARLARRREEALAWDVSSTELSVELGLCV